METCERKMASNGQQKVSTPSNDMFSCLEWHAIILSCLKRNQMQTHDHSQMLYNIS